MNKIRVYGTKWCGDCIRSKAFMDNNKISYEWTDVDEESQHRTYIRNLNKGMERVPTIVFPDGSILVEPTDEELAAKLDL
jgi:glutaredoxin